MNQQGTDTGRRRMLTGAATVVGGVGAAFVAVPFLSYWSPSAKTQAAGAPVEVDIGKLEPGQLINVEWRGKPVWVLGRSQETLDELPKLNDMLRDPNSQVDQQPPYVDPINRAIRPEVMVVVGICTHLGCSPLYRPEEGSVEPGWVGGFFCPCHGSKFDLAGRVYSGVPAPTNLVVAGCTRVFRPPPTWWWPGVLGCSGPHQPGGAAVRLPQRHPDHHRRAPRRR